jgi:cytochrome c biogenesis protein ResB
METFQANAAFIGLALLVVVAVVLTWCLIDALWTEWEARQERRRAQIEAELDAQSERLRQTILSLAEDLATDRDEASKALTRAMFLTNSRNDTSRS